MSRTKDKKTISEMKKVIDQYLAGRTDLLTLSQVLEIGARSLDSIGLDWKKKILEEWVELEIVYSDILERDELNMTITEKENSTICDTLSSIKGVLDTIDASITEHFCPSCGADLSDSSVWYTEEKSNDFCYCCGFRFDRQVPLIDEVKLARDHWLLHPEFWKEPNLKPDHWKIEDQICNIPSEYL